MILKNKLRERKVTIGSWITMAESAVAEIMASAGFEWLVIDMEHSAIGIKECENLIRIIELSGVVPLVRVGANDPLLIKRVMDCGAHGVIVPMVNSKEEAQRAVSAAKYPPDGTRGVGLYRAQGYGTSFEEYKSWVKNESIVIVQIEHIDAVNSLEEILSVKGVDAFIVGPYDLSASLGITGKFNDPRMTVALKKIIITASGKNVSSGCHVVPPDYKLVQQKIKEGYSFIAFSVDFLFLGENCRQGLSKLKLKQNSTVRKT